MNKFNIGDRVVFKNTYPGRSGEIVSINKNLHQFFSGDFQQAANAINGFCQTTESTPEDIMNMPVYTIFLGGYKYTTAERDLDSYKEKFPDEISFILFKERHRKAFVFTVECDLILEDDAFNIKDIPEGI